MALLWQTRYGAGSCPKAIQETAQKLLLRFVQSAEVTRSWSSLAPSSDWLLPAMDGSVPSCWDVDDRVQSSVQLAAQEIGPCGKGPSPRTYKTGTHDLISICCGARKVGRTPWVHTIQIWLGDGPDITLRSRPRETCFGVAVAAAISEVERTGRALRSMSKYESQDLRTWQPQPGPGKPGKGDQKKKREDRKRHRKSWA